MQTSIASQNAPAPHVVIPHFVFGGLVWLASTVLIIFSPDAFLQHYFNMTLLALTHLLVLGWITMMIFGSLYQLIPVILEVKIFSEHLAMLTLILLACGTILLTISFWNMWLGLILQIAAGLIVAAVCFFTFNIAKTSQKSAKKNMERPFIMTSAGWLLITVISGMLLGVNLTHPFLSVPNLHLLKIHAHLGMVGWIMQLIVGVSSRLLPMFMIAHELDLKKLKISYYLMNAGLLTGTISLLATWQLAVVIGIMTVLTGIFYFLWFLAKAFRHRVKKNMDIGMRQSLLAFGILTLPFILIFFLGMQFNWIENSIPWAIAYGSSTLVGFVTALILGQTYKILPFIVWLHVYRGKIGKLQIPLPKDLYSDKAAIAQFWFFLTGFLVFISGIVFVSFWLIRLGGIFLLASAILYNFNVFKIVLHRLVLKESGL